MSKNILETAGEALYGPRWQTDLAGDLSVSDRTMRRWIAGDVAVPPGVQADLVRLIDERMNKLRDVRVRVKGG